MKINNREIIIGIVIGFLVSSTFEIVATTIIPSESVSYANSKTSEVTVSGALNELFSAVKINETIGNTDISNIADGTITGAVSNIKKSLNSIWSGYDKENSKIDMITWSFCQSGNILRVYSGFLVNEPVTSNEILFRVPVSTDRTLDSTIVQYFSLVDENKNVYMGYFDSESNFVAFTSLPEGSYLIESNFVL